MARKHWYSIFWTNARVQKSGQLQFRATSKEEAVKLAKQSLVEDKNYNRVDIIIQNCYQIYK